MTFVLENIRSAWNVGSAFRTADCLNANIILTGYTPRPIGNNIKLIQKTAIGAQDFVKWEEFELAEDVFLKYPNQVHLAAEITQTSLNIFDFISDTKDIDLKGIIANQEVFIWFGNEIHGVEPNVLQRCNKTIHLPMWGKKESLNIASSLAAFGYLMKFAINKQN